MTIITTIMTMFTGSIATTPRTITAMIMTTGMATITTMTTT